MCVCVCVVCGAVSRACAEVTSGGEARVDSRALFACTRRVTSPQNWRLRTRDEARRGGNGWMRMKHTKIIETIIKVENDCAARMCLIALSDGGDVIGSGDDDGFAVNGDHAETGAGGLADVLWRRV